MLRIPRFFQRFTPFFKRHKRAVLVSISVVLALIIVGLFLFLKDLPSPTKLKGQSYPVSTKILDRHGTLLYEFYADHNRTPISMSELPAYVAQASIAIEDQNFYNHHGFDLKGITRAIRNTLFRQRLQGGSTITQQLVKTALLTRNRTLSRKIKEALLTVATELVYKKNDILEMYLNHIPYGGTAWGIEAAAKTYFGKPAKDLTLSQAALLAGLPASPTTYSPFGAHPELAKKRQLEVLRRMVVEKYITQEQADKASNEEIVYATDKIDIQAPHFVFYVKDLLSETYSEQTLERGGLRVTTSLDLSLQAQVEASLSAQFAKLKRYKIGNAAALVTNPKTGEILAMVGSQNYFDATHDGQVNVTVAERQPGSSIKPLNYATAFELKKLTPGSMLLDIPTCFLVAGQQPYCPKNYDGTFRGPVQERFALGNSYNIPAVKTLAINGLETFIATASAMGISTWNDPSRYGLSLTLGGGEVMMTDLATAYGVLANQGVRVDLHPILKVEDYAGKVYETYDPQATSDLVDVINEENGDVETKPQDDTAAWRVMHRAPAYLISHILLDNNARSGAFGSGSQLVIPNQVVSVKTGTTNDLRDNWTIGYTPSLLTAVWVGNNDNTPMNRSLVSGVTGAAPIWHDIMAFQLRGKKQEWPDKPIDVVSANICITGGLLPTAENMCQTRSEFFWKGTEPKDPEMAGRDSWIMPTTGLPPKEGEPQDGLQLQRKIFLSDPFTKDYCWDCVRPVDEKGQTVYEQYNVSFFQSRFTNTQDE